MQPVELVRVVIQAIRRRLRLVVVVAVVPSGRLLLAALTHDVELLTSHLYKLVQRLLKVHVPLLSSFDCRIAGSQVMRSAWRSAAPAESTPEWWSQTHDHRTSCAVEV
jgi:hypothetical protein